MVDIFWRGSFVTFQTRQPHSRATDIGIHRLRLFIVALVVQRDSCIFNTTRERKREREGDFSFSVSLFLSLLSFVNRYPDSSRTISSRWHEGLKSRRKYKSPACQCAILSLESRQRYRGSRLVNGCTISIKYLPGPSIVTTILLQNATLSRALPCSAISALSREQRYPRQRRRTVHNLIHVDLNLC